MASRADDVLGQVLIGVDPEDAVRIHESSFNATYEPDLVRNLLAAHGYYQVTEGSQSTKDVLDGRERYRHNSDGTAVYLDLNPYQSEGYGRWSFHHAGGVQEGFSHKHLAQVLTSWAISS